MPAAALADVSGAPTEANAPAAPRNSSIHTVADGESLASIAERYKLSIDSLRAANPSLIPNRLEVGQQLVILPADGVVHTVAKGDSVGKIAERYGVKADIVQGANGLDDPESIKAGMLLFIPGGKSDGQQASVAASGDVSDPRMYEVQPGETLWSISRRFGIDPSIILADNDLLDPKAVQPGSKVRILPARADSIVLQADDSLAAIAAKYHVDLGALLDYNRLDSADAARPGARLMIPQTNARSGAQASVDATGSASAPAATKSQVAAAQGTAGAGNDRGTVVAAMAMKLVGSKYVFGGTSPSGFDCSGFAYYVQKSSGVNVGRTLWQQFNAGPRVAKSQLQIGDEVFFANTYMPGLSHAGIYIGDGRFVHANNERTGVVISRMDDDYWSSRYVGAARVRGD